MFTKKTNVILTYLNENNEIVQETAVIKSSFIDNGTWFYVVNTGIKNNPVYEVVSASYVKDNPDNLILPPTITDYDNLK